MPTKVRVMVGGMVYHVLNRANGRMRPFEDRGDYQAFLRVLSEAHEQVAMRTIDFAVMPNHWHLVLWPREDGDLPAFMHWLSLTHSKRWHGAHGTTGRGHIYQGRYRSFPVEEDQHYLRVCRYVQRNALRAGLVARAEDWQWSSLWARTHHHAETLAFLSDGPRAWPDGWLDMVNSDENTDETDAIRTCISRRSPFGNPQWAALTAERLGLTSTLRPRGRPRKNG